MERLTPAEIVETMREEYETAVRKVMDLFKKQPCCIGEKHFVRASEVAIMFSSNPNLNRKAVISEALKRLNKRKKI